MTRPTISNLILGIRRLRQLRIAHPNPHYHIIYGSLTVFALFAVTLLTNSVSAVENVKEQSNNISLSVSTQCSFVTTNGASLNNSYTATGANGSEASFNDDGIHNFNIACNQFSGYTVKAYAENLVHTESPSNIVSFYNYNEYAPRVENNSDIAIWSAEITSGGNDGAIFGTDEDHMEIIKSRDTASELAGDPFSIQYHAYIGRTTAPGVYEGKAVYTIAMNPYNPTTYMYTITYHANGIAGTPATQYGEANIGEDATVTLSNSTPTMANSNFLGWDTNPTAAAVVYRPNDTITISESNPNINLYAVWDGYTMMANGATMQDMSALSCANASTDTTYTLKDSRTNASYLVGKLADGNCWMLQNLYLTNSATLNDSNTDLNTKTSYTLPTSSTSGWSSNTNTTGWFYQGSHTGAGADSTSNRGSYFSYVTATAGLAPTTASGTAPDSVCPKNWKLPTGGASGQFQALYTAYSSNYSNMKSAFKAAYTSACNSSACSYTSSSAYWWSSTIRSGTYGYSMYMATSSFYPQDSNNKYDGFSIRCVLASS